MKVCYFFFIYLFFCWFGTFPDNEFVSLINLVYSFGDMVIFLQYSTVKMFSIGLPSSTLEYSNTSAASLLSDAAAVNDNEPPTWAISHALNSREYKDQIGNEPLFSESDASVYDDAYEAFPTGAIFDFDEYEENASSTTTDQKTSHHVTVSFEDDKLTKSKCDGKA